jgi:putative acetyltransferase
VQIRPSETADHAQIATLLKTAFPGPDEARLVVSLRAAEADALELVAEADGVIQGMVLFSPVTIQPAIGEAVYGLGLAPLAVLPDMQKRGIGGALVEAGLGFMRTLGAPFCVLLGAPAYYGRFGFKPARAQDLHWEGDLDDNHGDAFQFLSLAPEKVGSLSGVASYHAAFSALE